MGARDLLLSLLLVFRGQTAEWELKSALRHHEVTKKERLLANITPQGGTTRYSKHQISPSSTANRGDLTLVAVSAHNAHSANLLEFLTDLLQSLSSLKGLEVVLFFSALFEDPIWSDENKTVVMRPTKAFADVEALVDAIAKRGLGKLQVVRMRQPPKYFVKPIDVFTDTYIAQKVVMDWRLARPQYKYAWIIEQDVRFAGTWSTFFNMHQASTADILCWVRPNQEKRHVS